MGEAKRRKLAGEYPVKTKKVVDEKSQYEKHVQWFQDVVDFIHGSINQNTNQENQK